MTTAAKTSFGTVLKLAVSPGSPAAVAELYSITPPTSTREALDATTHDSADDGMEYIFDGVMDGGEIGIEGHYIALSAGETLLLGSQEDGVALSFEIVVKAASGTATRSGTCLCTSYGPGTMEVKGKQSFSATLKVSGKPSQEATA